MKTSVIATLANYAYSMGEKVLIITPGKKANDEIVKRCKSMFGLEIPSKDRRISNMITAGFKTRKDVKDPALRAGVAQKLSEYTWVLVDEVEYTMNDSGDMIYSMCTGAKKMYGFSGTSDKTAAECITFINGLSDVVTRNKMLVKYFGPSIVFRMPLKIEIDNITVLSDALNYIKFEPSDFDSKGNVYLNVMNRIWTNPRICNLVVRLVRKYPKLFIPINNLTTILSEWIDNYFIGRFKILLICGEGYIYYNLAGEKTKVTLPEACDIVKKNEVDVILSTSSGYRALDLPGLESIFLPASNIAGVVLQCIGRVARGQHMNIISIASSTGKRIPVYTKSSESREEMMKDYYKYCEITDSEIYEEAL